MRANKKSKRTAKPVYSFVVDGECEYWYLQMLRDNEPSLKIHLSPDIYKKNTPKAQYERVVELARESEKVFWIVDFDVINKETQEAKKGKKSALQGFRELYDKCKKNSKIVIVVNNPCFEFWALLHFKCTNRFYKDCSSLLPDLRKFPTLANYEKTEKYFVRANPDIYKRLKPTQQTAISNAEKLGEFDFENTKTGIAEMHKIFRELLDPSRSTIT